MSAVEALQALLAEICSRAESMSWKVSRDARLENMTRLESATLLQALEGEATREHFDMPGDRVALLLRDSSRLLIAAFDQQSDLLTSCRSALWWAGLVRGSLQPVSRADLHLFIVATSAPGQQDAVLLDRSRIEADERICRKHVWLPDIDAGASEFLDSTFLAHPWRRDALAPQSLDPLQRLVEADGMSPEVATKWVHALLTLDDVKVESLAEVLSDFYEQSDDV